MIDKKNRNRLVKKTRCRFHLESQPEGRSGEVSRREMFEEVRKTEQSETQTE